jgi:serine-aspartate repeat-containing protein C/D/E
VPSVIWKAKWNRDRKKQSGTESLKRRSRGPERLEARRLLAADPIHVGVVYIETDYLESDQDVGGDSRGDRFILSFTGGAPETELREVRIRTDKDGDGISVGDPIYDTLPTGRGKSGAHGFQIVRVQASDGRSIDAVAEVADGGQELVLKLSSFRAGDRLEFTIDVDEVLRNAIDLAVFNDRLDVITSGQEFQDSLLEATFDAPHYERASADAIFLNDYGDPAQTLGLDLPPDKGDDPASRPNRSAAAVGTAVQVPRPVELSGRVWVDNDLDQIRQSDEQLLEGVEIELWRFDQSAGRFVDTGLRATTGGDGQYRFPKSLGLQPGRYRLVETQPSGLISVASLTGTVDGTASGVSESKDIVTAIEIPLGDMSARGFDFAEAQPSSITGSVYRDDNDDGVRGATEVGIAGVRIELVPIDTIAPQGKLSVTTAGDGSYRFTGLVPGEYEVIEVDQPANLIDGKDSAGRVDGRIVGAADDAGDRIRDIRLDGDDHGIDYNFGELPLGSLTGFVYLAAAGQDCTGTHDAPGNRPLANVRLSLQNDTGQTVANTTTATDGSYRFGQLPPGTYRIVQITPTGLIDGASIVGRIGDVTVGDAIDGGSIQDIILAPGNDGVEYNFCEASPGSISGYVYHDRSDDGTRDSGEEGIAVVEVRLLDVSGRVVATKTTDPNGRYEFTGLAAGRYSLVESQPTGYLDGLDRVGQIRGQSKGRVITQSDTIDSIQLRQGDEGIEYNFGELLPAMLSGRVHADIDADCVFDPGEQGIEGVTIRLVDTGGNEVARTVTDVNGQYRFEQLDPGTYTVIEQQPAGVFDGSAKSGSAGGTAEGRSRIAAVTLSSGEVAVDYDFCERPASEISGTVFNDADGDHFFDPNESGIGGVRIELYDGDGKLITTTQTDSAGRYRFSYLPAGEYMIREVQPAGWIHGSQMAGDGGGNDSVVDLISGIAVGWGQRLAQYNFCEVTPASISGVVFVDANDDCTQDPGEDGLSGVIVELRDASGSRIASALTDSAGRYRFDGLAAGQYSVFEQQPEGVFDGGESAGRGVGRVLGDDLLGVDLLSGQTIVDFNFCELMGASITGRVWHESDPNQKFEPGDVPVPGVMVELIDDTGETIRQTTTNRAGHYLFDSIAPGIYSVREIHPSGLFQGGQLVGNAGGHVAANDLLVGITLTSGKQAAGYDFPEIPPATISGYVFQDGAPIPLATPPDPRDLRSYSDGQLSDDDTRLSGVTIELRHLSGLPADAGVALPGTYSDGPLRTVTDANGFYEFRGLRPGTYHLYEVQPEANIDGLDSPGTAGGVAVNPADEVAEQDLATIAALSASESTDPGNDAILNIRVRGGQQSLDNNFSEIVIEDPVEQQLLDVSTEIDEVLIWVEAPLPDVFDSQIRLATFAAPPQGYAPLPIYASDQWMASWHLSVINGGYPRGDEGRPSPFRSASSQTLRRVWSASDHNVGRWTVVSGDDESGPQESTMTFGVRDGIALTGDFDGDGFDEAVIYAAGQWFVDLNGNGKWDSGDLWIRLGSQFDRPVVGDWDGDGKDDVGIFGRQWQYDAPRIRRDPGLPDPDNVRRRLVDSRRPQHEREFPLDDHERLLYRGSDDSLRSDAVDHVFQYGEQIDTPVSGDWNGDGIDQIAIFRDGQWLLDLDGDGRWTERDALARFGEADDQPVVGDFNGDEIDEIGVVRGDMWIIDTDGDRKITGNDLHVRVPRPSSESQPVVGDFDGDGKDELGYYDDAA